MIEHLLAHLPDWWPLVGMVIAAALACLVAIAAARTVGEQLDAEEEWER